MISSSDFKVYSAGIVAKNKEEDGDIIEVFPIESQTYIDGDIDFLKEDTVVSKDIYDKTTNIKLNRRVTVKAKWLALTESNRITSPNVKKGETVLLYRFANTDEFYWVTVHNELDLRRREKVIHYYGNTGNFKEVLNNDNTYWTKIDTYNKLVQMHTSDNDGELTTYDFEIDTKAGKLKIEDGKGNIIELDSDKDKLTISINKDVEVNTENIVLNATTKMDINTPVLTVNGNCIKHNDINIGYTHIHPESIGSKTSPPDPC